MKDETQDDSTLTNPYLIAEGMPGYVPYGSGVPDFFIAPFPSRPPTWRERLAVWIVDRAEGIAAWILR